MQTCVVLQPLNTSAHQQKMLTRIQCAHMSVRLYACMRVNKLQHKQICECVYLQASYLRATFRRRQLICPID